MQTVLNISNLASHVVLIRCMSSKTRLHCHLTPDLRRGIKSLVIKSRPQPAWVPSRSKSHHSGVTNPVAASTSITRRASSIRIGRHVREALANGSPIVALESTVITHGLPEPKNLELALSLEDEILSGRWWFCSESGTQANRGPSLGYETPEELAKRTGYLITSTTSMRTNYPKSNPMFGQVTPATVGIVKGQLVVGLSRDEIEFLASKESSKPIKASRRDLAIAQALKLSAGTTVSATMALATSVQSSSSSNRISVFATGGLGGVHLDGQNSMDISADLYEMARSPMAVVSSGFKSFLDTRRSLEFLETMGCTVASLPQTKGFYEATDEPQTYNDLADNLQTTKTREQTYTIDRSTGESPKRSNHLFPGFFTSENEQQVKSPWRCDHVHEAALILFHCLRHSNCHALDVDCRAFEQLHSSPMPQGNEFEFAQEFSGKQHPLRQQQQHLETEFYLRDRRALLLACPIPEEFALDCRSNGSSQSSTDLIAKITQQIESRLDLNGNEKTPLILAELSQATGGQTLKANLALLRNNARVGAHLAYEYADLCSKSSGGSSQIASNHTFVRPESTLRMSKSEKQSASKTLEAGDSSKRPIVIGCTMIDVHVRTKIDDKFKSNAHYSGVTFNGEAGLSLGGVGRNLAAALELLGREPIFITSLADDNLAEFVMNEMNKIGFVGLKEQPQRLRVIPWKPNGNQVQSSSCCALVLIDSLSGQCEYVIANLEATKAISAEALDTIELSMDANGNQNLLVDQLREAPICVIDANIPEKTIEYLIEICHQNNVPIFLEPTDVVCLPRLVTSLLNVSQQQPDALKSIAFLSPNIVELQELLSLFAKATHKDSNYDYNDETLLCHNGEDCSLNQVKYMANCLMSNYLPDLKCLIVTMDKRGVLVGLKTATSDDIDIDSLDLLTQVKYEKGHFNQVIQLKHYQPDVIIERPVSASGAGDCFAAGFISGLIDKLKLRDNIELGFKASACALKDRMTVPITLKELANISKQKCDSRKLD